MQRSMLWELLLVGVLVSVGCKNEAPEEAAKLTSGAAVQVTEVAKGDEVWVRQGDMPARVRLVGLYAFRDAGKNPTDEKLAADVQARLVELVAGKEATVVIEPKGHDVFARYLVYLDRGDVDVARKLIEEGLAVTYDEYAFAREAAYLAAESTAREAKHGLWSDDAVAQTVDALHAKWRKARAEREAAAK